MLSGEFYRRIRFHFFRLHFQFIMANDQRAPYDYFMLVGGPVPVVTWARDPQRCWRHSTRTRNWLKSECGADGGVSVGANVRHRPTRAITPATTDR